MKKSLPPLRRGGGKEFTLKFDSIVRNIPFKIGKFGWLMKLIVGQEEKSENRPVIVNDLLSVN